MIRRVLPRCRPMDFPIKSTRASLRNKFVNSVESISKCIKVFQENRTVGRRPLEVHVATIRTRSML
jgi:hypothetical protein